MKDVLHFSQNMALISEISSTSGIDTISEISEQLVKHYSQSVHQIDPERPPHFDPLLGQSKIDLPPVLTFLLDRLITSDCDVIDYILGYEVHVRPQLMQASKGCIQALIHYELLLTQWLANHTEIKEFNLSASRGKALSCLIDVLVSDLSSMTATSSLECSHYARSNIAIPCCLRILHFSLTILNESTFIPEPAILTKCATALLAFDTIRIDSSIIIPSLLKSSTRLNSACAYPSTNLQGTIIEDSLSLQKLDWSFYSMDSSAWNDLVTGILCRAADRIWIDLGSLVLKEDFEFGGMTAKDILQCSRDEKDKMRQDIIQRLGVIPMSTAVRAHFFGRQDHMWESKTNQSSITRVLMGKQIIENRPVLADKPFKSIPSRIYVALMFFYYLSIKNDVTLDIDPNLIQNLLPISLELIESSNPSQSALGISTLIQLLGSPSVQGDFWVEMADQIIPVLDLALDSAQREGRLLILIGQAQTQFFTKSAVQKDQRRISRKWLTLLQHSTGSSKDSEFTCWDILVGGVIPLLYEHAQLANADAMEIGRFGLATILPLLDTDMSDTKTLVTACIALINLMVGAYPMMGHHGGKIMSQLLTAAASLSNDEEMTTIKALIIHTASVAYVLCGGDNGFGGQLLNLVKMNENDVYQDSLVQVAFTVTDQAANLVDR